MIAFAVSLIFAFSRTFWNQAIKAEVYTLNVFFVILLIYILFLSLNSKKYFYLNSFIFGLGLTNHQSLILIFIPIFGFYLFQFHKEKLLNLNIFIKAFCLFLLGLSVYLYLPISASFNPQINWGNPSTFSGFLSHVLREQYGKVTRQVYSFSLTIDQIYAYLKIIVKEFTIPILILAVPGLIKFKKENKKKFIIILLIFLFTSLGFIILNNFEVTVRTLEIVDVFFIQSFLIFSIFIFYGIYTIILKFPKIKLCVLILPILPFYFNIFPNNASKNYILYDYGKNILATLEPNSVIFTSGDNSMFSLAYLKKVEKEAPSVTVYDDEGYVFTNIYGDDFRKLPINIREKRRNEVQLKIINESSKSIYYTVENTIHSMPGIELKQNNLILRVVKYAEGKDYEYLKKLWTVYKFRGSEDKVYKNYFEKDLLAQFYYLRAEFSSSIGEEEKASKDYELASKLGVYNEWIQNMMSIKLEKKGSLDEAILQAEKAVEINPYAAEPVANLGVLYEKKGLKAKAIDCYKKAISLKPTYARGYFNLGNLYMEDKLYNEAIFYFKKVMELDPFFTDVYINLGNMYEEQGETEKAIENYFQAIKINPKLPSAYVNLGYIYSKKGNYQFAMENYKKAIEIDKDFIEAHFNLGAIYITLGKREDAIREFKYVLAKAPDYKLAKDALKKLGVDF